jgi:alanine dehydrogenase
MHVIIFLAIRALHVGLAALWIGSTVFASVMLTPAIEASGPSGGQVMTRLNRHGLITYMAVLASTTLATGLYLFWHFTGGFGAGVMATHAGIAFGTGGVSGILAAIIGGGIVGRSAAKMTNVMAQAVSLPESPGRRDMMQQALELRRRMKIGSRAVILLQTVALVLMAVGHYV